MSYWRSLASSLEKADVNWGLQPTQSFHADQIV